MHSTRLAPRTASPAQVKFLADLITDLTTWTTDPRLDDETRSNARAVAETLAAYPTSGGDPSKLITQGIGARLILRQAYGKPQSVPTAPEAFPAVPDGRYCIDTDGDPAFYKVKAGRSRVFIDRFASDNTYPVIRNAERSRVLLAIAADPKAAGVRFGQLIEKCCRCGRTLTDKVSRERGIGPECASKGW